MKGNQNGIKIIYKINKNEDDENKIRLFGDHFFQENSQNCKIIIKNKEDNLREFYNYKNDEKELEITLIVNKKLNDLNGIFRDCFSLYSIINLSSLDISEVNDMSFMFYGCSSLQSLSDISKWDTSKVTNMSFMFNGCSNLKSLDNLSKWNTSKVTDMSFMFYECSSLSNIQGISKWNTPSLVDMNSIFYKCQNLEKLPDISNWKISNEVNKDNIFYDCSTNHINIFEIINKYNKKEGSVDKENIESFDQNEEFKNNENCKVLRNDNLKFLPQIEIKFEGNYNIENNMITKFKNEIKEIIGDDNFSLIEINKGSFKVIITLQYIYKKVLESIKENPAMENIVEFPNEVNKEVIELSQKMENNKFLFLGSVRPDFVQRSTIDLTNKQNQKRLKNLFNSFNNNRNLKKVNIYEQSKNISINDLDKLIDLLSDEAEKQEINQLTKNFEEFYNSENEIEAALAKSILEYKIINIYLINRDNSQYINKKQNCPNRETKLLFHGTLPKNVAPIFINNFNCYSRIHLFGQGTYFTDDLDYTWFYSGNQDRNRFRGIPKVGESFSFIVSETYYDKSKMEMVYNIDKQDLSVESNGVRCCKSDGESKLLSKEEIQRNKGFIAQEFLISDQNQIFPIYVITMKRCEYLIIWRDYNFDESNPNNYGDEEFQQMVKFNEEIKKFSSREVDSKVYYVKTSEEGLKLIKRKKYNKIILITNGNNESKQYISDARKIIGSDCIALVSAFEPYNHLDWVKDFQNTLISNKEEFHKKFIRCVTSFDLNGLKILKSEIEEFYGKEYPSLKFKEFNSEVLKYPLFKNEGKFTDMIFE